MVLASDADAGAWDAAGSAGAADDAGGAAVFAAGRCSLADLLDATSSRCLCGFGGRCCPSMQAFKASGGILSDMAPRANS